MSAQKNSRLAGNEAAEPEVVSRAPGSTNSTAIENGSQVGLVGKLTAEELFERFMLVDPSTAWSMLSMEEILTKVLDQVLAAVEMHAIDKRDLSVVARLLLRQTNIAFRLRNDGVNKQEMGHFRPLLEPTDFQVARLVQAFFNVKRIAPLGLATVESFDLLAVRDDDVKLGLYVTDPWLIEKLIRSCKKSVSPREVQSVREMLFSLSPRVEQTSKLDPKNKARQVLIPVANGVFDRRAMKLRPYTDDDVFLNRFERSFPERPPAIPTHTLPDGSIITYEWWEKDLFKGLPDQDDVHRLLVQLISAACRPEQSWNRALLVHSTSGNSGKSSILELIENIYGRGSTDYASIPISQFGERFGLVELNRARLVISHENSVSEFSRNMACFKAAVTGDPFSLEMKGKDATSVRWKGLIIQGMNSFIETNDKSGSFARRLLWIPFPRNFAGSEIPEIKDVFLASEEVLDYVFYRALTDPCEELSNPFSCQQLKGDAMVANNPVQQFWNEMSLRYAWDEVPLDFLHEHYNQWRARYNPNSLPMNKGRFRDQLVQVIDNDPHWGFDTGTHRVSQRLREPEPLIHEYGLDRWANKFHQGGNDPHLVGICSVPAGQRFTGWFKRTPAGQAAVVAAAARDAEEEKQELLQASSSPEDASSLGSAA